MEITSDLPSLEFDCNGVIVPMKFALITPYMIEILREISFDRFNPFVLHSLSPSVLTHLSGIELETTFPVEGNPGNTSQFKLVKRWAEDKPARKAQFQVALYLNLCVCLDKKKLLPYGLRDLLIYKYDHNVKNCVNWYFTNVHLRIELSRTNKSVLLAILARNTMMYRSNTLDDNKISLAVNEKKVPSSPQDLLFFRLFWLLESFVSSFLKTCVIVTKTHKCTIETGDNLSRKQLFDRFVTWMNEECDNVPTEMFNVNYTTRGCFHEFVCSLLIRLLTGKDAENVCYGFYVLDKTKKIKN